MVYGKSARLDMDRLVDMLQALEAFLAVRNHDGRGSGDSGVVVQQVEKCTVCGRCGFRT
jgi:hypothetical protein